MPSARKVVRRIRPRKKGMKSYPNIHLNDSNSAAKKKLPDNKITTTKYSPLTFIPKNLYEQFRRMTNVYFLIIVIITLIPAISPLTPWTSIMPLTFVLGVTAIKEGYEDFQRFKADATVNYKKYSVLKSGGGTKKKRSQDLQVGDMVIIKNNQFLPADVLPLRTAIEGGTCYIETAQLDGETNLKVFRAPGASVDMSNEDLLAAKGHVEAAVPSDQLYKWVGAIEINGKKAALDQNNLLLRGARLRNTEELTGVVVYTGKYTKLSQNQKVPPSKFSTIDRRLNKSVVAIFLFKMFCVTVITIGSAVFNFTEVDSAWYLYFDTNPLLKVVQDFFGYFALLSFMIPMSLMVTLEVVKVIQGKYMEWDREMAIDPNDPANTGMKPKTTNLNDELALVRYVFSDKTGTLTENVMEFQQVSVGGVMYDNANEGELKDEIRANGPNADNCREFLTCLAVCQTVQPTESDDGLVYQAESPDEAALCDGARNNGYALMKSAYQDKILVDVMGETQEFELLGLIEFSSKRARMSVIVRTPDGRIMVYSKGADTKMWERMGAGVEGSDELHKTKDDLESFSNSGLRTLVLGSRELSEDEYQAWAAEWHAAETAMQNRDELKEEAAKHVEANYNLLGCTAIEDKLQQEVPETIHNLLRANIKVWVITGDNQQTAENIGHSCRLLKHSQEIIRLIADTPEMCSEQIQEGLARHCNDDKKKDDEEKELAVVVNGTTLGFALNEELRPGFLKLTSKCHSVVCCRVSPIQKAEVVKHMKAYTHEVCLSIGDGANDVSMILEAHIGVGIFGKEGAQAARSSDYAIREFRHLKRLVTVHGRYSLLRNSGLIQYSIYKNAATFLVQFWFAFYCGYSATTIYDDWIVTFFNIFFTSVPPLFYAIFEKDISESMINDYPESFRFMQSGTLFCYSSLFTWMLSAIWHSLVFFFGSVLLLSNEPVLWTGRTTGLRFMGNMASSIAVVTVILKIITITNTWNFLVHLGIWGSIAIYILVFAVESAIPYFFPTQYFMFPLVVSNPNFWGIFVLTIVICLAPDVFMNWVKREFYPDDWMILQEAEKFNKMDAIREDAKKRMEEGAPEDH
mmetsp:Transcript_3583/g.12643  ORF Transcript_3583/g.12643 Transcript_3583/m.12643 type:complete len:1084 (-) Transcript_3583:57-3308(-)